MNNHKFVHVFVRYVNVRKGDVIGIQVWALDAPNIVSYDAEECKEGEVPSLAYNITRTSSMNQTFYQIPAGSKPCR